MNLQRQGFSFENFLIRERVALKRGIGWRTVQMFSNYIFVEIVDQWRAVKSTRGISNLLMTEGEKPGVVPDEFITSLRALCGEDGLIVLNQCKFKNGDEVQIKSGPFAYMVAKFDGLSSRDRVFVMLSVLGATRRIEMREDNLVAA